MSYYDVKLAHQKCVHLSCIGSYIYICTYDALPEIRVNNWPFSKQFQDLAEQNLSYIFNGTAVE